MTEELIGHYEHHRLTSEWFQLFTLPKQKHKNSSVFIQKKKNFYIDCYIDFRIHPKDKNLTE